jgi:sporulation protein YlmC with PRC-barrel domain
MEVDIMFNKGVFTRMTIAAAVSGLALTTALAQSSPPAPTEKAPSATTTSPNAGTNGAATPKATDSKASTDTKGTSSMASAAPMIVTTQSPDQLLASKFKGTDVIGVDGKKIGDIDDVLFEKDGRVSAYVIGVGGVLGIGAKQIALDPSSVEVIPGKNGNSDAQLKVAMNKDELSKAAEFKPYAPPRPATSPRPATPSPMAPK